VASCPLKSKALAVPSKLKITGLNSSTSFLGKPLLRQSFEHLQVSSSQVFANLLCLNSSVCSVCFTCHLEIQCRTSSLWNDSHQPPTLHHHRVFYYFFAKGRKISSPKMHVFYISQLWFCRLMGGLFPNFNENVGRKAKKFPLYACFFCLVFVLSV
jgi:hypothetical protein